MWAVYRVLQMTRLERPDRLGLAAVSSVPLE
jgi:hypothetical protein